MNVIQERPARMEHLVRESREPEPAPRGLSLSVLIRYALVVAVAGYLVFCHGCHGDEDNELFALLRLR